MKKRLKKLDTEVNVAMLGADLFIGLKQVRTFEYEDGSEREEAEAVYIPLTQVGAIIESIAEGKLEAAKYVMLNHNEEEKN